MSFAHVDNILEAYKGTPSRKMVLLALGKHANGRSECFPKVDTLARLTCQSRRTVQRALNELEQEGTISRVMPCGKVTRYVLRLEEGQGCQNDTGDNLSREGCQNDTGGVSQCHGRGDTVTPEPVRESVTEPTSKPRTREDFEEFLASYPLDCNPTETAELFHARVAEGEEPDRLVAAARAYADECRCRKTRPQFVTRVHNFLSTHHGRRDTRRRLADAHKARSASRRMVTCSACRGRGVIESDDLTVAWDCDVCEGQGVIAQ